MSKPKVLLFDLGGVIVKWTGIESLMEMTGLSRTAVTQQFANDPVLSAYEIGACSDDDFTAAMLTVFSLDISYEHFKSLWKEWVGSTYPGIKQALSELRGGYTIACLSNTNAMHWQRLADHIITSQYFDHAYASHLVNLAKPDPAIYRHVLTDMGINAADVWFFDDTLENVEAAKAVGIKSFLVDRQVGVLSKLEELGLANP
jgi:putative hydrolase of the HAD superfamily